MTEELKKFDVSLHLVMEARDEAEALESTIRMIRNHFDEMVLRLGKVRWAIKEKSAEMKNDRNKL